MDKIREKPSSVDNLFFLMSSLICVAGKYIFTVQNWKNMDFLDIISFMCYPFFRQKEKAMTKRVI